MPSSSYNWDDNLASWDDLTATWDGVPIAIGGYGISKEDQLPLVNEKGEKTAKEGQLSLVSERGEKIAKVTAPSIVKTTGKSGEKKVISIKEDKTRPETVNYKELIPHLLNEMQNHNKRLEVLENI